MGKHVKKNWENGFLKIERQSKTWIIMEKGKKENQVLRFLCFLINLASIE